MKRRAFLAGIGGGGLSFYSMGTARAGHRGGQETAVVEKGAPIPSASQLSATTHQQISQLISIAPHSSRQERILHISRAMKGTSYLAQPLIGSATIPEELVLSWRGVNCMTFVEIVLAASLSHTVGQFIHALVAIRYRQHRVLFAGRRHFFSDWLHGHPVLCRDLDPLFPYARSAVKTLNLKVQGAQPDTDHHGEAAAVPGPSRTATPDAINPVLPTPEEEIPAHAPTTALPSQEQPRPSPLASSTAERYLPGLPLKKRRIAYLPAAPFLNDLHAGHQGHARKLVRNGDIIGMYSPLPGLDVFHIGFAVWHGTTLLFRNASSLPEHRYVVDTPLATYLRSRRGILLYRPL